MRGRLGFGSGVLMVLLLQMLPHTSGIAFPSWDWLTSFTCRHQYGTLDCGRAVISINPTCPYAPYAPPPPPPPPPPWPPPPPSAASSPTWSYCFCLNSSRPLSMASLQRLGLQARDEDTERQRAAWSRERVRAQQVRGR